MVRDHTAVNEQGARARQEAEGHARRQRHEQGLTKQADEKRAKLAKLDGAAFDKAYVENEVAYHKTVNGALERHSSRRHQWRIEEPAPTGLKIFQGHEQHAEHLAAS